MKLQLIRPLLLFITVIILSIEYQKTIKPKYKHIIIADTQQPVFGLIYIADKMGYFKSQGLKVSYRKFDIGKKALDDVIEGNSDLATVFESPVVHKIFQGKPIKIITTLHTSKQNTALIVRKDKQINKLSDLVGKKIAVTKGTNADFFLNLLLKTEGIDKDKLTIIDLPADQATHELWNGTIDAAALYNPYLYIAQQRLENNGQTYFSEVYTETSLIAGTNFVNPINKSKLVKLLTAIEQAEQYVQNHKQNSQQIIDDWLPMYDRKTIIDTWDSYQLITKLDNKLISIMEREAQFYYDTGVYRQEIPYFLDHIYFQYLQAVDPEHVTIY